MKGSTTMTWQSTETAPKDGSVFYIATLVKWTPYKLGVGKGGRWQEHTGYGWRNLEVDEFVWQPKNDKIDGEKV